MKLETVNDGISVVGALDRHNLVKKQQFQFPKLTSETVTIDLKSAEPIDTAGLAWILKCVSFYKECGKQTSILNAPEQLIALAELSNVLGLLPLQHAE